jgi:hypothetical protein
MIPVAPQSADIIPPPGVKAATPRSWRARDGSIDPDHLTQINTAMMPREYALILAANWLIAK